MQLGQGSSPVEFNMLQHRIALVGRVIQQDAAPEIHHHRDMGVPGEIFLIPKNRPNDLVLPDPGIKSFHQVGNVLSCGDFWFQGYSFIRFMFKYPIPNTQHRIPNTEHRVPNPASSSFASWRLRISPPTHPITYSQADRQAPVS